MAVNRFEITEKYQGGGETCGDGGVLRESKAWGTTTKRGWRSPGEGAISVSMVPVQHCARRGQVSVHGGTVGCAVNRWMGSV